MSTKNNTCDRCHGSGEVICSGCGGTGKVEQINEDHGYGVPKISSCAGCHGKGTRTCGVCGGSGEK